MKNNIQLNKPYDFRKQFCPLLNISDYQATKRKKDLLLWLTNFYDYDFVDKGERQASVITITEIYGSYKPIPRKFNNNDLTAQKILDYDEYVRLSLPDEYKPLSYSVVARDAISEFGYEKYGHESQEAVARRFIKPAFNRYGETNNKHVWVWYNTYSPLNEKDLQEWFTILKEEKIGAEEAANAFYRYANGEDISKEISYYKKALERFKNNHKDFPINVREWRTNETN